MKTTMKRWDEWLRRRFRVYNWKQKKVPKARNTNLMKLGISRYYAHKWGYVKDYWNMAGSPVQTLSITNERLAQVDTTASLPDTRRCTYAIEPPCTEPYARWCERTALTAPPTRLISFFSMISSCETYMLIVAAGLFIIMSNEYKIKKSYNVSIIF